MRRTSIVLLTIILALGVVATPGGAAKKPRQRTVETPYSEPALGTAGIGLCFPGASCVFVEPMTGERYVSVEVVDDLGLPVYASVMQDTNGDGSWLATDDYTVHICGKSAAPIEIDPSLTVAVWVWQGPGVSPACPGLASSGVVKTAFSKTK